MKGTRNTEEQIIAILKEHEAPRPRDTEVAKVKGLFTCGALT
jgi:hypothetical protein